MGIFEISGVVGGALAVIAGIIVLIKPQILAWIVAIYLIIFGAFAILSGLGIT
jgi:hypothetical protein